MSGKSRALLILTYHRVLSAEDPLRKGEMTQHALARHAVVLRRWFNVLPLWQAWRRTLEGTLPARAVAITFDDGYADNAELALPILKREALTATFFVATGFLDGGRMWNDTIIESLRHARAPLDLRDLDGGLLASDDMQARAKAVERVIGAWKRLPPAERQHRVEALVERAKARPPDDLMMRSEQVSELARSGMDVGAHTVSHPILRSISDAEAATEMRDSRARLEALTGAPVSTFAYPNGRLGDDYDARHAEIAKSVGFELAVSTNSGTAHAGSDPYQLPRFGPWAESGWRFAARLLRAY
ncbi:MAG TPA: polysaccharide deacetylase family protein [Steroidobacteraceae bacterium]|nr:polysaccharide deacetylase family protein [Steroidobacteraceae bacterium]